MGYFFNFFVRFNIGLAFGKRLKAQANKNMGILI